MRSVEENEGVADDRTAKARIRDAAITRFAADGVSATNIRAIAVQAGVSPGLVIHHFGSKDALRRACDEHVVAVIRAGKREAMSAGSGLDALGALRGAKQEIPLTRYLARTLADGSPQVAELVDEMASDAAEYMAEGVKAGTLRPTAYPRERAAVVLLWSLGTLVLHEHLERLVGVDLMRDPSELADLESSGRYFGPVREIYSDGLFSDELAEETRTTLPEPGPSPDDDRKG